MSEAITNINHSKIVWTRDGNDANSDTLSRMSTKDDLIPDGIKHKQLPPNFSLLTKQTHVHNSFKNEKIEPEQKIDSSAKIADFGYDHF